MAHDDRLSHFTSQLLKLGKGVGDVFADAAAYPNSPELNIAAALLHLYGQTLPDTEAALAYLAKAKESELPPQLLSLWNAAYEWANRDMGKTLKAFEKHCFQYPQDLLAIKVTEFIFYCNGQKYCSDRFLKLTTHAFPLHKDNGYFLAIHSFAQELSGDISGAQKTAEEALRIAPDNPWAHHTLSHVYLNTGQITQGIEILEKFSKEWPFCNRMIESHNFWHLALMYFENLQQDELLGVITRGKWNQKASMVGEEVDAASLLWRMDMQDPSHGLWTPLANAIDEHADFCVVPFVSAQLLYALKRGGKEELLSKSLAKTYDYVTQLQGEEQKKWQTVGLPLIEGALAFADGQFSITKDKWEPIIKLIPSVGGSDAQSDLFNIAYLKTLLNLKQEAEAVAFLKQQAQNRLLTEREKAWIN